MLNADTYAATSLAPEDFDDEAPGRLNLCRADEAELLTAF